MASRHIRLALRKIVNHPSRTSNPSYETNILFVLCVTCTTAFGQKFDQLALTPPMGWNSWNKFASKVNEELIRQTADAMVASGMKDAGYQYVNIDDCWQGKRDGQGFIHPDAKKFPSGMKALADYVHSKGLKLGIYSDAGTKPAVVCPPAGVTNFRTR